MSLLLAVSLAAVIQPTCSWDRPGQNPYTGSAAAAIDRYTDIPAAVRSTLKRRIEERQPDDTVSITRDSIGGKSQYNPAIHDMHFGAASVCSSVTRSKWADTRAEPAAVYCVGEHCILVPKICGNVSRISRLAPAVAAAPATATITSATQPVPQFADLSLVDPEAINQEPVALIDDLEPKARPTRQHLANTGRAPGGVQEFAVEEELDLDDIASRLRNPSPFGPGFGVNDSIHTAVPEAETWAMLLSGLGLMGWIGRRRTKAATKK
jgi:hypothetical protein